MLFQDAKQPGQWIISDYATYMSAYFLLDGWLLLQYQQPDTYTFLVHHIVSMKLIQAHVENIFPVSIGIHFLAMFEISNVFMQMFQMCHWQGWISAKKLLIYPFVSTYVPLRMLAIPYYSLRHYAPVIWSMPFGSKFYYGIMLLFVNMFSMAYAMVVSNKFLQYISNN